ncbi:hypothetical protein GF377_03960 [candidate division GN15 bacterium]|nr:hypothetical protein [candidate division GN15 bacterium]
MFIQREFLDWLVRTVSTASTIERIGDPRGLTLVNGANWCGKVCDPDFSHA